MTEPPFVKRGQFITATLWNQLCAAVRACRLIAGDGVRLRDDTLRARLSRDFEICRAHAAQRIHGNRRVLYTLFKPAPA